MRLPFCDHHICAFLHSIEGSTKPLDLELSNYFRSHKSTGAHDRRLIGETLYGLVRWKTLVDYLSLSPCENDRLTAFRKITTDGSEQQNPSIPEPIRLGISDFLYNRFVAAFGIDKTRDLCRILNSPAPTTLRVNLLKITRDELMDKLKNQFDLSPCTHAPAGIYLYKRAPLFS